MWGNITDDLIKFWDKLSLAYRNYSNQKYLEIGRMGEKLSIEYEKKRTGFDPIWQSIESNLSGFDILSVLDNQNKQRLKIEVKATTNNLKYAKFHLTKNEWDTANASLFYEFHLWHISEIPKLYTVNIENIEKHIPIEKGNGRWESVEISYDSVINGF